MCNCSYILNKINILRVEASGIFAVELPKLVVLEEFSEGLSAVGKLISFSVRPVCLYLFFASLTSII